MKQNNGITLISLVITIIVMLILAGVTVVAVINGGLIGKAGDARDKWNDAQQNELNQMDDIEKTIAQYTGETSGETISKDVTEMENNNISYIGYFADVDNDGEVDGVIFADLLVGTDSTEYTINTIEDASTVKNYEVIKDSYTVPNASGYASKPVLKATGDGVDRFYVMALEDFTYVETKSDNTTETHTNFCWYAGANYTNLIDNLGLSTDFETGESNTSIMKQTWNSSDNADKKNTSEDGYLDIWGVLNDDDWFVPSKSELKEFISAMGMNESNSEDFNYIKNVYYWTSSKGDGTYSDGSRQAWGLINNVGTYSSFFSVLKAYLFLDGHVRLSTTF